MDWRTRFIRIRDGLVYRQVYRTPLPDFPNTAPVRYRVIFSGRVQGVGFRYETALWAQRLALTGFCENLPNGDVLAELQGPRSRIDFYLNFMNHLKRIRIDRQTVTEVAVIPGEQCFLCETE